MNRRSLLRALIGAPAAAAAAPQLADIAVRGVTVDHARDFATRATTVYSHASYSLGFLVTDKQLAEAHIGDAQLNEVCRRLSFQVERVLDAERRRILGGCG
jgi:hypothetical protein